MTKFLILVLIVKVIYAQNLCKINDDVMLSVMVAESHKSRGAGYRYLISFNNKKDALLAKKSILRKYFIDSRTIDCKNERLCVDMTKRLWKVGIKNLDLGAFQINSLWHKYKPFSYFRLSTSYYIACNYIMKNIKKRGLSWESIAGYHSFSKIENEKYKRIIQRAYKRIKEWKENYKKD